MPAKRIIFDLAALLLSTSIFLVANGLQGTLMGVRAGIEGFETQTLGYVMTAYFVGYLFGSFYIPGLVERVGHIRVFTACASIASISTLLCGYFVSPLSWALLRIITGFCLYGLYVVVESWINTRATKENRGSIFSLYMIINLGSLALGQFLLNVADPSQIGLFILTSVLISLSVVPVCLTGSIVPTPIKTENMSLLRLLKLSPLGTVGLFFTGVSNAAFWGLSGIYAYNAGLDNAKIASFIALVVLGGMAFQWPLGWLSDKTDRRFLITITSFLLSVFAFVLFGIGVQNEVFFLMGAFVFGGFLLSVTSVCTSHINDIIDPNEVVPASGAILLTYGIGAIIGPVFVSNVMDIFGNNAFFVFIGCIQLVVGGFGIYRSKVGKKLDEAMTVEPTIPMTPHLAEFDPRLEEAQDDTAS